MYREYNILLKIRSITGKNYPKLFDAITKMEEAALREFSQFLRDIEFEILQCQKKAKRFRF